MDWDDLVRSLDVPFQIRTEIEEKYSNVTQRKQAMLEEWRNTTPAPSWMAIANALYRVYIDGDYGKYHKVFQLVKEKYLKSKWNSIFLHAYGPHCALEIICSLVIIYLYMGRVGFDFESNSTLELIL